MTGEAANYVQTVVAALAGGRMPQVMSLDAIRDMAEIAAQAKLAENGGWQQAVDQTTAAFASLEAGELENVQWFATGVLTGMLLAQRGGRAT